MTNVQQTRQQIREWRRGVPNPTRAQWSRQICERMGAMSSFHHASAIAGYLAFDGEADPLALMVRAVKEGKRVFVPRIVAKSQPLKFVPWTPTTPSQPNRFGILEPQVDPSRWISPEELDFVIAPLVAFDCDGHRVGVGGGYYDRSFGFLKDRGFSGSDGGDQLDDGDQRCNKPVALVGFAFELQRVEPIQPEPWDVRLEGVVTEDRVYGFGVEK